MRARPLSSWQGLETHCEDGACNEDGSIVRTGPTTIVGYVKEREGEAQGILYCPGNPPLFAEGEDSPVLLHLEV